MEEQLVSPTVKELYDKINPLNGEITTKESIRIIGDIEGKLIVYEPLFAYIYSTVTAGRYCVKYVKDDPYSLDEIIVYLGRKRYTRNCTAFACVLCRLEDLYNKKWTCRVYENLMRYKPIEPEDGPDPGSYWYLEDNTSKEVETPTVLLKMIESIKLPEGIKLEDFKYIRFIFSFYF